MTNFQWKSSDHKMMEEQIPIKFWPQNGIAFHTHLKILIEHEDKDLITKILNYRLFSSSRYTHRNLVKKKFKYYGIL